MKRGVGDEFVVEADAYKDGHDLLGARVRFRADGEHDWRTAPMTFDYDSDRWSGSFVVDRVGRWTYTVEAWTDEFGTWRSALEKKLAAAQDVGSELLAGAALVERASRRARGAERQRLRDLGRGSDAATCRRPSAPRRRSTRRSRRMIAALHDSRESTFYDRELPLVVDRERARFAAWYEMFPRSQAHEARNATARSPTPSAGLPRDRRARLRRRLPAADPSDRRAHSAKGKNNALDARPDDVGSPWAIGGERAATPPSHPELGTLADFDRFVARRERARPRDRARLRAPVLARSSVGEGASRVVLHPPGRHASSTPRIRRRSIRTSIR